MNNEIKNCLEQIAHRIAYWSIDRCVDYDFLNNEEKRFLKEKVEECIPRPSDKPPYGWNIT